MVVSKKKARPSHRVRMERYTNLMRERGFKQMTLWVPANKVRFVRSIAERWRREMGHTSPRAERLYPER